jgi:hypothetical protein
MSEPIDFEAKKKERQDKLNARTAGLYACECGSAIFRLWDDQLVECINCGGALVGLRIVDDE